MLSTGFHNPKIQYETNSHYREKIMILAYKSRRNSIGVKAFVLHLKFFRLFKLVRCDVS